MDQDQAGLQRADAGEAATPVYVYKRSLMGAPWQFALEPDRLAWTIGHRSGSIPYGEIERVRLLFRPVTMQSYRFEAEIRAPRAPKLILASTSWRGMLDQERLDRSYRDFIIALHRRIAVANGQPVLEAGSPAFLYWPGFILFAGVALGIAGLLVRALQQESWPATLFLLGFFALLLWQIGGFFRRNRPRRYTIDAIPDDVLPKATG